MTDTEKIFADYGIKPTANRLLIYRTISALNYAFSLSDLETRLDTIDRSSIFRTLTIFEEHHLLHNIDDGSGQRKYCLCISPDHNHHNNCQHVHIYCRKCGRTYCLKAQHIPSVTIPDGFTIEHTNYIITGICSSCRK